MNASTLTDTIIRILDEKFAVIRYSVSAIIVAAAGYAFTSIASIEKVLSVLNQANLIIVALAIVVFYATFAAQAVRWQILLKGAGENISIFNGTQIIFLSWFVNVVIPARAGDVYRCFLAENRSKCGKTSVLGTIASERMLDMALLAIGTSFGTLFFFNHFHKLRNRLFAITGGVLGLILLSATVLRVGRGCFPDRYRKLWLKFKSGFTWATELKSVRTVVFLTVCIWVLNVLRFGLVSSALSADLNLWTVIYVSLLIGFLSGIPITPAGIGIVELVGTAVLIGAGITGTMGASLVLLDRIITTGTVIFVGVFAYTYFTHVCQYRFSR